MWLPVLPSLVNLGGTDGERNVVIGRLSVPCLILPAPQLSKDTGKGMCCVTEPGEAGRGVVILIHGFLYSGFFITSNVVLILNKKLEG